MSSARVFMGNLPLESGDKDIEDFFRGYGKILDIQRKEGYAIVVLSDPRDAEEAISDLNGKTLLNNRIKVEKTYGSRKRGSEFRRPVQRTERRKVVRTSHRVFIKNLSSRVSWQDLKDYMSTVSQPTFADAHKKFRNEGMVEFSTHEDMKRAISKLDGTELNGRIIRMVPDDRTRGRSPVRNRFSNKRKRSTSPATSMRPYARESRSTRRFRSKESSFRDYNKRPRFSTAQGSRCRHIPRSRSIERRHSRSRSQSSSSERSKSPLNSPMRSTRRSLSRSMPYNQRPKSPSRSRSRSNSTSEPESKRAKY